MAAERREDLEHRYFFTDKEAWELFDGTARRYMNMSGDEFVRKWDGGEITDPDRPNVMRVLSLLPLARR